MDVFFPCWIKPWFKTTKRQIWNATSQKSISGVRRSLLFYTSPIWEFTIPLNVVLEDDIEILQGFVALLQGTHNTFYFVDPTNKQVDQPLGTGDGVTKTYQLARSWGWEELYEEYPAYPATYITSYHGYGVDGYLIPSLHGYGIPVPYMPEIYIENSRTTDYTLSASGVVTFNTAPVLGEAITASFYHCYLACFQEEPDTSIIFPGGWSTNLKIETVKS